MAKSGRARFHLTVVILALAAAIPILACGGKPPPETIPQATLAPSEAGVRVAILSGTTDWKLVVPTPDAPEGHVRLALLPAST